MSERRLRRFFTQSSFDQPGDIIALSPSESDHLTRVLRYKKGDACLVVNTKGNQAQALVLESQPGEEVKLRIESLIEAGSSAGPQLFVYPAMIQKGKMDELVRQLQELGIAGFYPIETERSVLKLAGEAKEKVSARWTKICQEAAKQSGSTKIMRCAAPQPFEKVFSAISPQEKIAVFHPGVPESFSSWTEREAHAESLHLFFGPEGGFSDREIDKVKGRASLVRLTGSILKADTAVLGVASALRFLNS